MTSIPRPSSIFIVVLLLILNGGLSAAPAEWQNSLKPKGSKAGDVILVDNGKARCAIQIAERATEPEKKAAEELQVWIEQITTARVEITIQDTGPAVQIRRDPALGEEGYRIAIDGDDLVLAGGTGRGTINAVYALLEEDLGCRFYTNEAIKLPTNKTLVVQPVARSYIPQLRQRDPYYSAAFDATWSLRNRTNTSRALVGEEYGGHIDFDVLFLHTHLALLPPAIYLEKENHPDYYSLSKSGERYKEQLCPTHPDVTRIITTNVLKTLKESPHTEIVSVSKNDNMEICHCERCSSLRAAEGDSDIACQLVLVNAVAEAVEQEFPNVVVSTLAYEETLQIPKTIRPRKNVAIQLCNGYAGGCSHPFTPAEQCDVADAVTAWANWHDQIYVLDYAVNFHHYFAPIPNLDVIASNIRFWVKNHAKGVMILGGYQGPSESDELRAWVMSKLLWDPSRDEKELVQDFIFGHYGSAAPAIAEYWELQNHLRETQTAAMAAPQGGIYFSIDAPFLTEDFLTQAAEIFTRAKRLAADNAEVLRRVERAELPILYVKLARGQASTKPDGIDILTRFERIARREGVTTLREGTADFETTLAKWKASIQ